MSKFLALFYLLVIASAVRASDDLDAVARDWETLQRKFRSTFQQADSCKIPEAEDKSPYGCSFVEFCSYLKKNVNSASLYGNKAGYSIPNLELIFAENAALSCVQNKLGKLEVVPDQKKKAGRIQKLYSDFKAHLNRNGDKESFEKLYDTAIANVISEGFPEQTTNSSNTPFSPLGYPVPNYAFLSLGLIDRDQFPKNRESLNRDLSLLEEMAGIKLAPASREAYLKLVEAVLDPPPYKLELPRGLKGLDRLLTTTSSENPFFNEELLKDTSIPEGNKVFRDRFQAALDRSEKLIIETKEDIISLLNRKKTKHNAVAIDSFIKRISTVHFKMDKNLIRIVCEAPNAFYNPIDHSFNLCPNILGLPDESLRAIIAHELGHSIDPCTIATDLQRQEIINQGNPTRREELNRQKSQREEAARKELLGISDYEPQLPKIGEEGLATNLVERISSDSARVEFDKYRKVLATIAPAVGLSKNPFGSVISCLTSSQSAKARLTPVEEYTAKLDENIRKLKEIGQNETNSQKLRDLVKFRKNLDGEFRDLLACGFMESNGEKTQIQEAFSDWISGEVMASRIVRATSSTKKRDTAFEVSGLFFAYGCDTKGSALADETKSFLLKVGCMRNSEQDRNDFSRSLISVDAHDPHTWVSDRVNRIFLAQPAIRSALGCGGITDERRYCADK
jgi:hypothetical protein